MVGTSDMPSTVSSPAEAQPAPPSSSSNGTAAPPADAGLQTGAGTSTSAAARQAQLANEQLPGGGKASGRQSTSAPMPVPGTAAPVLLFQNLSSGHQVSGGGASTCNESTCQQYGKAVVVDELIMSFRTGGGAARTAQSGDGNAEAPNESSAQRSGSSKPAGEFTCMVQPPPAGLLRSTLT